MSCSDIKIEAGMIVKNHSNQYKITKIVPHNGKLLAYASYIQKDGTLRTEESFGPLTSAGLPDSWGLNWDIVDVPKTAAPAVQATNAAGDDNDRVMNFFRTSSHPENCPKCGAPKPCSYHP